ncbi:MAG: acetate uptake transporter [Terriglobia bacterium]
MATTALVVPRMANPAPLGLAGFGLTTVLLSLLNAALLPAAATNAVIPLAFAYGGAAQIIAGILEYRNGNTFGTVAFISYGTFWWWYALLLWTLNAGWLKSPGNAGLGVTLLLWGVFTLYMWVSTFRLNVALWLVFLTLWITYGLLAAGSLGAGLRYQRIGGWVGLACGIIALYTSFAEVTNDTFGRRVIPLGSLARKA